MTNNDGIFRELQRKCDWSHEHQALLSGRARWAARYPAGLCRAICRGLLTEMKAADCGIKRLAYLRCTDSISNLMSNDGKAETISKLHESAMDEPNTFGIAWDDISGGVLDVREVKKARQVEAQYIKDMK
eukprot:5890911-Karenia_brevis.AAC.1